jgi:hypothetical protein
VVSAYGFILARSDGGGATPEGTSYATRDAAVGRASATWCCPSRTSMRRSMLATCYYLPCCPSGPALMFPTSALIRVVLLASSQR